MPEPGSYPEDPAQDDDALSTAAMAGVQPDSDVGRPDLPRPDQSRPIDEPRAFERDTEAEARTTTVAADRPTALYSPDEAQRLRDQWSAVQASFVDEPRQALERADNLVAVALKHLAETFAEQRSGLEGQWDRGDQVSTEDLRLVLQQYRSFFDRLLSI